LVTGSVQEIVTMSLANVVTGELGFDGFWAARTSISFEESE
jgi:hypothetical protein